MYQPTRYPRLTRPTQPLLVTAAGGLSRANRSNHMFAGAGLFHASHTATVAADAGFDASYAASTVARLLTRVVTRPARLHLPPGLYLHAVCSCSLLSTSVHAPYAALSAAGVVHAAHS